MKLVARWKKRKVPQNHSGTVYLVRMMLDGEVTYKVGITTFSVTKRILQIIQSVYVEHGYFPEVRVIRQGNTKNHFKVEKAIHNQLEEFRYIPIVSFSGSTELFRGLSEEIMIERYELAINSDEPAEENERLYVW